MASQREHFTEPDERLAHLTWAQVLEVRELYLESEIPIAEIIETYDIETTPAKLYKLLPARLLLDEPCPYCETPMQETPVSRTSLATRWQTPLVCADCGHQVYYTARRCTCSGCRELAAALRRREAEDLRVQLRSAFACPLVDPYEVCSFTNLFYWFVLNRALRGRVGKWAPPDTASPPIAPTIAFLNEMLISLQRDGACAVDTDNSALEHFILEGDAFRYWPARVAYRVSPAADLVEIPEPMSFEYPDIVTLWRAIAAEELIRYLRLRLEQNGFPTEQAEERARPTFQELLIELPPSQVIYYVWRLTERSAHNYVSKGRTPSQAAYEVPDLIGEWARRALREGWNIPRYNWDSRIEVSRVASTFYSEVLQGSRDELRDVQPSEAELIRRMRWG